jgi:hypothetical protein|tara:strand:+ start:1218 stop:1397 length:180 start_codon:yes stop_codon:yes gene_type:complete
MAKIYRQPQTSHKPLRACWIAYDSNAREEEVITIYSGKVKMNGFKFRKSGKLYSRKSRR